jgi:hypothetical protein
MSNNCDSLDTAIKLYLEHLNVEDGDDFRDLLNIQIDESLETNIKHIVENNFKPQDDTAAINILLAGLLLIKSPPSIALNIITNRLMGFLPEIKQKSEDND